MKKILIAPNSYKGSADSVTAAIQFKKYLSKFIHPDKFEFIVKPISDGGDGFLNVCKNIFDLEILSYLISAPSDKEKIKIELGYSLKRKSVYIESAKILGLEMIPVSERRQLELSSKGMGELLFHLKKLKEEESLEIEKVIIGIGGTGTSDLGIGCAGFFGLKLFDANEKPLKLIPENFYKAEKISLPKVNLPFEIGIVIDVDNPLLGEKGAAKVYAKQKGASSEEINIIEKGFVKILNLMKIRKAEISKLSGAGRRTCGGIEFIFWSGK